jgi:alpha-glucosidase (family GH31 glycosyl hydrolase)
MPVMRPMWVEFPADSALFEVEDQWMVGSDLLVKPVTSAGQSSVTVTLPGSEPWYDAESHVGFTAGRHTVDAPLVTPPTVCLFP